MKKIRKRIKSDIFQNILSLSFIQLLNYIIPFITVPYVVRILGPEKFGLVNFAAAFVGYFSLVTDYGFNLSATRQIAINRESKSKVNEIVSAVFEIKFILFFTSIIFFIVIINTFQIFGRDKLIYMISFVGVLGNLLTPLWFFRGIERMRLITVTTIIVRVLSVILIFQLVKIRADYYAYASINCFSGLVIGVATLMLMKKYYSVSFSLVKLKDLIYHFKEGGLMFISSISISLYTLSNTFVLGLFAPTEIVGYFTAADKIRMALQNLLSPITLAIYPHLSRLFAESGERGFNFIKKIFMSFGMLSFTGCACVFFFSETIVMNILGNGYQKSIVVLKIIAFLPFIIFVSNLFGIQTMFNLGYKKSFTLIVLSAGLLNIILAFLIVPLYLEIGTSISVLITEIFVTCGMIYFLKKNFSVAN